MAFQFYNPAPVLETLLGTQPLAGGSLTFYEQGTTTPLTTYSDSGATVPNANPVELDSSGRSNTPIFLTEPATVVLKDSLGAVVWTRDVVPEVGQGLTIPALAAGFLTNDGVNLLWQTIREMPDPTGSTNQYPVTNGAGYTLVNIPTDPNIPDPETEVGANFYRSGVSTDPTKFLQQWGNDTAPASGSHSTVLTVNFPIAYSATPEVFAVIKTGAICPAGLPGVIAITSVSTSNFSVKIDVNDDDDRSEFNISGSVPFGWHAVGTLEVPPP